jgi:hypothetical protein
MTDAPQNPVLLLAATPNGDAYPLSDLDPLARAAGFSGATARPLSPTPQTLVIFANPPPDAA